MNLLLVPPTSFKYVDYPTLIPLWNLAQHHFKNAKIIVFIGYSFSDSDDYIVKMVTDALRNALTLNNEIYLLVFDISDETVSRLKKRIKLHVENFDQENNLISFIGDANELVPKVLREIRVETIKPEDIKSEVQRLKHNY